MNKNKKYLIFNVVYNIFLFVEAFYVFKELNNIIFKSIFIILLFYKGIFEMIYVYRGIYRSNKYSNQYLDMPIVEVCKMCADKWFYKNIILKNIEEQFYCKSDEEQLITTLRTSCDDSIKDKIDALILLVCSVVLGKVIVEDKEIVFAGVLWLKYLCDEWRVRKEREKIQRL